MCTFALICECKFLGQAVAFPVSSVVCVLVSHLAACTSLCLIIIKIAPSLVEGTRGRRKGYKQG